MSRLSKQVIEKLESLPYAYVATDGLCLTGLVIPDTQTNRKVLTDILVEVNKSADLKYPYFAEQEGKVLDIDAFVYKYLHVDKKGLHYRASGKPVRDPKEHKWVGIRAPKVTFLYEGY